MAEMIVSISGDVAAMPLRRLAKLDFAAIHKDIGEELHGNTLKRFRKQVSPDGVRWAPLSPATKKLRRKKAEGRKGSRLGVKILQDTGALKRSINVRADARRVRVGPSVNYSADHQFGVKRAGRGRKAKIPARPYLGISDDDARRMREIVHEHIAKAARK